MIGTYETNVAKHDPLLPFLCGNVGKNDNKITVVVDDKIRLEYASLTETFAGAIVLDEKPPIFVSGGSAAPKK